MPLRFTKQSRFERKLGKRFPVRRVHRGHEEGILDLLGENGTVVTERDHRFDGIEPVLLCFTNRSGSNMLAEDLAHVPGCGFAREWLNYRAVRYGVDRHGFAHFADYLLHMLTWQDCARPALKVSVDQLLFLQAVGVLENCLQNVRVIHVRRQDLLSQAVSFHVASVTKQWSSAHEQAQPSPAFDEERILKLMNNLADANARLEKAFALVGLPTATVFYEDHVVSRRSSLERLSRFLGLGVAEISLPERRERRRQVASDKQEFVRRVREMYVAGAGRKGV